MRDGTLDYLARQPPTSLDKSILFDPTDRMRRDYASRKKLTLVIGNDFGFLRMSRGAAKIQARSLFYIAAERLRCGHFGATVRLPDTSFSQWSNPLNVRVRDEQGTVAADPLCIAQPMFAYQHEAAKACEPDSWLSPGSSRSAGYGRGNHGVVGDGAGSKAVVAPCPQVSGRVSETRLSREAHSIRWKRLLPAEPVAASAQGHVTEVNGGSRR